MSRIGDQGSGTGDREDHLDRAIDRAVREMLDVEPPPGLRGRVLDQITDESAASAFRRKDNVKRKVFWIAAPIAAAAILVLAVLLPSKPAQPVVNSVTSVATREPQPAANTAASAGAPVTARAVVARTATRQPQTRLGVSAAVADEPAAEIVWVDPLSVPAPVTVPAIEPERGDTIQSIDLAPREIPALEIRPISDTPRERRNQE